MQRLTFRCYQCKSIVKVQGQLADVKQFFEVEIYDFWKIPLSTLTELMLMLNTSFACLFVSKCTFTSDLATCVFEIEGEHMEFCLPTIIHIYVLNQETMTAERKIWINRKSIGLTLLKKACWVDMKSDPNDQRLYWSYKNWFSHQVVPMSLKNSAAFTQKSQDLMVALNKAWVQLIISNCNSLPLLSASLNRSLPKLL